MVWNYISRTEQVWEKKHSVYQAALISKPQDGTRISNKQPILLSVLTIQSIISDFAHQNKGESEFYEF